MNPLTVLSLFAGIGGLELGLERAGMRVVGQVELDPWCRQVLAHHWPEVPRHDDVRTAVDWWHSQPRPDVELVAGGFPCQPFSTYGRRRGIADERWGWPWMRDVIDAIRPRYVLAENVAALLRDTDAFRIILDDLSHLGYLVEWSVVPACSLGAPHTRQRLFVLAHPAGNDGQRPLHLPAPLPPGRPRSGAAGGQTRAERWLPEPDVGRVAHGLPKRLVASHLRALGNAVVPAVTEHIGRALLAHTTTR
ncbi:DNA (cytosine-5)-methyltransferase 1 [Saccharopolyspora erythraea NRRL 2338]|uniref:Cytosine-specific methyltransferase n=2 Tax=Saccharopolyspora erythraea TaxID=1836 RepID=A4F8S9_SACEN|nr:DNA (cytosine-5-)-methyltransferase [Saccharopolyspora erythraea]EQD86747.1 DNA methyltransferase [Saccharopolyspora erythraea D]PFG94249.1 DNA (cytosine-5)-methyltransferase 1 [Saccharopolyspora erythraea NRRL 2338]QRK91021.1 DNA (cytosine-5-)-methyltransferase [Saccharopolyspora erythraea]CAM00454.1 C-5 cytosine-specific DNA methylase [Saccharopolyspora erythraea NRRL 2338]